MAWRVVAYRAEVYAGAAGTEGLWHMVLIQNIRLPQVVPAQQLLCHTHRCLRLRLARLRMQPQREHLADACLDTCELVVARRLGSGG